MPDDKEAPVYTAEQILLKRVRKVKMNNQKFSIIPTNLNYFQGKVEYFIKWKGWAAK